MNMRHNDEAQLEILLEIKEGLANHLASPGHQYLEVLMAREAKRAKLWDAIIEKTLAGLVYSMLLATIYGLWNYIKEQAHIWLK